MQRIHPDLEKAITKEPQKKVDVLITLEDKVNPETLSIPHFRKLMDNIIAVQLKGEEILALSGNQKIQAIERDSEMEAI